MRRESTLVIMTGPRAVRFGAACGPVVGSQLLQGPKLIKENQMSLQPMRRTLGALLFLLCCAAAASPAAAQQRTYRLTGSVVDGQSQRPLGNVQVVLDGTQQGSITDEAGRYLLRAQVAPGTYTLRFVLIGRADATQDIVLAGDTIVQVPEVRLRESALQHRAGRERPPLP